MKNPSLGTIDICLDENNHFAQNEKT